MELLEQVSLAPLTTFHIGGLARYLAVVRSDNDVVQAITFAHEQALPFVVIGGGSNLLISDEGFDGVVLHMRSTRIAQVNEGEAIVLVADAGVSWDVLVGESVTQGLWGLENLSSIPGSVGGSVVQNIGAYGVEASSVVAWVEVYDPVIQQISKLSHEECRFGYRDSIFKSAQGRHLIVYV